MSAEDRENDLREGRIMDLASNDRAVVSFELAGDLRLARVPHMGHVLLLLAMMVLLFFLSQIIFYASAPPATVVAHALQPKRQLAVQAAVYVSTLGFSAVIFPMFWGRSFFEGINWNGEMALRQSFRLVPLGLGMGLAVQAISSLIPMPKSLPMDDFFRTPSDVWLVAVFGTLLAPLVEEIVFRGFLLPAFAVGFDWLHATLRSFSTLVGARLAGENIRFHIAAFPEDVHARLHKEIGNLFFRSATATLVASVLSSALFALLHGEQISYTWGGLAVLFCVSLVLSAIRVRSKSVACSTLVHASYNLSVFITIFVVTGGFRHLDKMAK